MDKVSNIIIFAISVFVIAITATYFFKDGRTADQTNTRELAVLADTTQGIENSVYANYDGSKVDSSEVLAQVLNSNNSGLEVFVMFYECNGDKSTLNIFAFPEDFSDDVRSDGSRGNGTAYPHKPTYSLEEVQDLILGEKFHGMTLSDSPNGKVTGLLFCNYGTIPTYNANCKQEYGITRLGNKLRRILSKYRNVPGTDSINLDQNAANLNQSTTNLHKNVMIVQSTRAKPGQYPPYVDDNKLTSFYFR